MSDIDFDGQFFWDGLERGELLVQLCQGCGVRRYPPAARCLSCGGLEAALTTVSGRGTLLSFTVVHKPPIPGLTLPMTFALVDLEEGVRIMAPLDRAITEPVSGMALRAAFGPNDLSLTPLRFVAESA